MKAEHAERAALLVAALGGIDEALEDMKRTDPGNYDRRGIVIGVEDISDSGSCGGGQIEIDFATGAKFMPLLQTLIRDELSALGVEVAP